MQRSSLERIAQQLVEYLRCQHEREEVLFQRVLRRLATGRPVEVSHLADTAGWGPGEVEEYLDGMSSIERDGVGRVVGWGLTLLPTAHRIQFQEHTLFTWCALDTLMYPVRLDRTAQVVSTCPITHLPITFSVSPLDIVDILPARAVMSLVLPLQQGDCTRESFCVHSHFFSSAHAASLWQATYACALLFSMEDAAFLGHFVAKARLSMFSGIEGAEPLDSSDHLV